MEIMVTNHHPQSVQYDRNQKVAHRHLMKKYKNHTAVRFRRAQVLGGKVDREHHAVKAEVVVEAKVAQFVAEVVVAQLEVEEVAQDHVQGRVHGQGVVALHLGTVDREVAAAR